MRFIFSAPLKALEPVFEYILLERLSSTNPRVSLATTNSSVAPFVVNTPLPNSTSDALFGVEFVGPVLKITFEDANVKLSPKN